MEQKTEVGRRTDRRTDARLDAVIALVSKGRQAS